MSRNQGFTGKEFLDVARHLVPRCRDEAFGRAAIGRCYYAAFLEARSEWTDTQATQLYGDGRDHHMILQNYYEIDNSPRREGQRNFRHLHGWRTGADYTLNWSNQVDIEAIAKRAIEVAETLINDLGR